MRSFSFHGVLGPDGTQADMLRACGITTLLDAALAGFHVTIFAYGQTGSGKTFTMAGREEVLALEEYSGTATPWPLAAGTPCSQWHTHTG